MRNSNPESPGHHPTKISTKVSAWLKKKSGFGRKSQPFRQNNGASD